MQDVEPPKPTEEFHKAYLEIYGKKKKEEKPAIMEPAKENMEYNELEMLDIPPIRLSAQENRDIPALPKEEKKTGILGLFEKKPKQEMQTGMMLPPLEPEVHKELFGEENKQLSAMDLPPPKKEMGEKKKGLFADLFKGKQEKKSEISMLSEPPKKREEFPTVPPLLEKEEIETPRTELERVTKKQRKGESTFPEEGMGKAMPRVHDFLAEIKYGQKAEKKDMGLMIDEQKESLFERTMSKKGARDMQIAFEKKHPRETAGFEYEEKIKKLEKLPEIKATEDVKEESILEVPRESKFKSGAEAKKYMKLVKAAAFAAKKQNTDLKKKQNELQQWMKKQQQQEEKINEKMKKMQTMERELREKQTAMSEYEPQLQELYKRQDAILDKEREIKQRQEDIHETEVRVKAEENAIVAKIKRLEADQKMLEKEQDAITRSVAKLDKERLQIQAKNREFVDILSRIGSAEKELKEKAQILDDREQRIKKKEKIVETELARVEKLKKTAQRLKDVEETYTRMKERLRVAYKEYEEKFSNQQAAAPREIRAVPIQPTFQPLQLREAKGVDSGDITNLMTATKQLIMDKHYDEANKNLTRLTNRYMQIPDNNPRKKEIYYEILGLKNMLKLDLLE